MLLNPHEITGTLERGVILDEQSNNRLVVYKSTNRVTPIMQYVKVPRGFYRVKKTDEIKNDPSHYALTQENDTTTELQLWFSGAWGRSLPTSFCRSY